MPSQVLPANFAGHHVATMMFLYLFIRLFGVCACVFVCLSFVCVSVHACIFGRICLFFVFSLCLFWVLFVMQMPCFQSLPFEVDELHQLVDKSENRVTWHCVSETQACKNVSMTVFTKSRSVQRCLQNVGPARVGFAHERAVGCGAVPLQVLLVAIVTPHKPSLRRLLTF